MKTLYEKLTKKQRIEIEKEADKYPNTWGKIMEALTAKYGSTFLTIEQAMTVYFLFYSDPFDLTKYMDLFDNKL